MLRSAVLPAAGGAALAYVLFLCLGRWAAALGSAAGVVVGFAWANYTFEALDWENTGRLAPWRPWDPVTPSQAAWRWLPAAGLLLVLTGLVSRWLGLAAGRVLPDRWRWRAATLLIWLPRSAAVGVASGWLVPASAAEYGWVPYALPAVMLASWAVWDGLARAGAGGEVAAYQAAALYTAGAVLLYHHWAGATEVAVIAGSALAGVAVVAWAARADASGAVPAGVAALPVLMLAGRLGADSQVPLASFWLVALAPLALAPFLVPRLSRQNGWLARVGRAVLALTPLILAVVLAAQYEQLAFEEEW
jgi:hypothetical protein